MDPEEGITQIGNASSAEDDDYVIVDHSDCDYDFNYVHVDSVPDLNSKGLVANFIFIKAQESWIQRDLQFSADYIYMLQSSCSRKRTVLASLLYQEDVRQKILSNFQNAARGGIILSAFGSVLNPTLICDGKTINYRGSYGILELESFYSCGRGGKVKQTGALNAVLDSPAKTVQGVVLGSLIAATPVQENEKVKQRYIAGGAWLFHQMTCQVVERKILAGQ